jgi:recombination protein RecA
LASDKERRLEQVAETIQRRWGSDALRKLHIPEQVEDYPHIPTGFPVLDRALGIGGVPRNRVSEIVGLATSGVSTLALQVVASAQKLGDSAVWMDLSRTFDADYAEQSGVQIDSLLLVRPPDQVVALHIAQDFITSKSAGIIIIDLSTVDQDQLMSSSADGIRPLIPALSSSSCALIFLTRPHQRSTSAHEDIAPIGLPLAQHASLQLRVEKVRWLRRRSDIRGYRTRIVILKNKLSAPGRPVTVTFHFPQELP